MGKNMEYQVKLRIAGSSIKVEGELFKGAERIVCRLQSRKSIFKAFLKSLSQRREDTQSAQRNSKAITTNMIVVTEKLKENRDFANKNLAISANLGGFAREKSEN